MLELQKIPTLSGIYKFINLISNKIYIGSAINLRLRFIKHISSLKNNSHHSIHLQNAWNKYGEENFEFEIIEIVSDYSQLLIKEQYYLDTLLFAQDFINNLNNKFVKLGYNINPISSNRFGTNHSEYSKYLISLNNPNRKEILQYDFSGNLISEWISSSHASSKLNLCKSSILNCCKHKQDYCGDFIFIFKNELDNQKDYLESLKLNPYMKQSWNKGINITYNFNDKLLLFDRYGRFINTYKTQKDICKYIKSTEANLSKNKNKKIIKNYYVFDLDFDYKPIINQVRTENIFLSILNSYEDKINMFDNFNNFICGFESVKECSEITGLNSNSIYNVLCGKRNQCKGYIFKYNEDIV